MGKKRRLKLSATRTAWRGGGGSSSVPWVPPPPWPPPPPRLFARAAAVPGGVAVAAIFFPGSWDFRGEAYTARSRGQKGLAVKNAKVCLQGEEEEGVRMRLPCAGRG